MNGGVEIAITAAQLVGLILAVMAIRQAVRGGMLDAMREHDNRAVPKPIDQATEVESNPAPVEDGPGWFDISGVNRATKTDTTWSCVARCQMNARHKAELEGIMVSSVRRRTAPITTKV